MPTPVSVIGGSVYDILGRALREGDLLTLRTSGQPIFKIERIDRALDASGHMFDLTLVCVLRFRAGAGSRNEEFLRVAEQAETGKEIADVSRRDSDH